MERSGSLSPVQTGDAHRKDTVLVVDDEPAVCRVTGQMLEFEGYRVLYAENREQALRLFDENEDHVSIVVADVVMPKMSGPQLAHLLRIQRPELPVLFVSGLVSYGDFEGVMGGAMLKKPYSASALTDKVRDVLASAQPMSGMAS
jgi:two-component system cell cycle sensor histidine kinase/response regulator CckA